MHRSDLGCKVVCWASAANLCSVLLLLPAPLRLALTLMKFMNSIWCAGDAGVKSQKLCITRDVGINTLICGSTAAPAHTAAA
jgi:hypothetical protein